MLSRVARRRIFIAGGAAVAGFAIGTRFVKPRVDDEDALCRPWSGSGFEFAELLLIDRDVDLVINDERDMDNLLKLLVHDMCTLDGRRNTARPYLDALIAQHEREFMKRKKEGFISQPNKVKIRTRVELRLN